MCGRDVNILFNVYKELLYFWEKVLFIFLAKCSDLIKLRFCIPLDTQQVTLEMLFSWRLLKSVILWRRCVLCRVHGSAGGGGWCGILANQHGSGWSAVSQHSAATLLFSDRWNLQTDVEYQGRGWTSSVVTAAVTTLAHHIIIAICLVKVLLPQSCHLHSEIQYIPSGICHLSSDIWQYSDKFLCRQPH